jgi:hypothetical protein
LEAPDHVAAIAINQQATGAGVSAQAFALRRKLLEVDAWVRHAGVTVVEVHPEVSFAGLAGRPLLGRRRAPRSSPTTFMLWWASRLDPAMWSAWLSGPPGRRKPTMTLGPPVWASDEVRASVAEYLGRLGRERAPRSD